jgi:hypothetical protein
MNTWGAGMSENHARHTSFRARLGAAFADRPAEPPTGWERAIRLGCQALAQAPSDLCAVRLEGVSTGLPDCGTRLLHFMYQAEAIASEYGLRATIDYHDGCPVVAISRG